MNFLDTNKTVQRAEDVVYEFSGSSFMEDLKPHPCDRSCGSNETSRTCHYIFVVELHSTLGKVIAIEGYTPVFKKKYLSLMKLRAAINQ